MKDSWFFAKSSKLQELFRILFCWPKKNVFPILKVFGINWSYIENSEKNICACLSRHETNFGATLSGSTYLIPTSLYSNSFARNLLMFKSGCIFLNFTLHSPALNISSEKMLFARYNPIAFVSFHICGLYIFCCCKNAVYKTSKHFAICLQIDNFILMPYQMFTNWKGSMLQFSHVMLLSNYWTSLGDSEKGLGFTRKLGLKSTKIDQLFWANFHRLVQEVKLF